jgi:hypothetical protein
MNAASLSKFLEKHGLATLIVIAGGWYVSQVVVTPLAQSYRDLVESVRVTNKLVTDEVRMNDLEDAARIAEITSRFDNLDKGIDEILRELRSE